MQKDLYDKTEVRFAVTVLINYCVSGGNASLVWQPEVFDGAVLYSRVDRLFPVPERGPTFSDIQQLKAWAMVEEGVE